MISYSDIDLNDTDQLRKFSTEMKFCNFIKELTELRFEEAKIIKSLDDRLTKVIDLLEKDRK